MIDELVTYLDNNKTVVVTVSASFTATPIDLSEAEGALPAALLYVGDDIPIEGYDGCSDVLVQENLNVLYACSVSNLETVKTEVRGLLLGYQPSGKAKALSLVAGGIMPDGIRGSVIWWRDIYETTYHQSGQ